MYVILAKGNGKDKVWEHHTEASARKQAYALAKLHSCNYDYQGNLFIVHAEEYYTK